MKKANMRMASKLKSIIIILLAFPFIVCSGFGNTLIGSTMNYWHSKHFINHYKRIAQSSHSDEDDWKSEGMWVQECIILFII